MPISIQKITDSHLHVFPNSRLIKAQDYLELVDIERVKKELAEVRADQEKQASELKLKSIETGLNQGAEQAKTRLAEQLIHASSTMVNNLKSLESELTEVVISAVQKIIDDYDDRELVSSTIKKSLARLYQGQKVSVRVHPDMVADIAQKLDLHETSDQSTFVELIPDQNLNARDCIMESDLGIVDGSIDAQVEIIAKAIRNKFSSQNAS